MNISPTFDLLYTACCFHFCLMGVIVVILGFKK